MIQSMTGYSRATRRGPHSTVTVELRSTNHRYLEIGQRMTDGPGGSEDAIAQLIKRRLTRGRIDVSVSVQAPRRTTRRVVLDRALARAYYERARELKTRFKLSGDVALAQLLTLPHVVEITEERPAQQNVWPTIRQAVQAAVRELLAMRRREGQRLVKDMAAHAEAIRKRLRAIRARLPESLAQQAHRLRDRLTELLGASPSVPPAQLQEAVALVRDVDIHEELVRLHSHLLHVQQALRSQGPIGKKLDFIAQELMREANTIGAKANDGLIARDIIEIKGAIEKVREQAQNLE